MTDSSLRRSSTWRTLRQPRAPIEKLHGGRTRGSEAAAERRGARPDSRRGWSKEPWRCSPIFARHSLRLGEPFLQEYRLKPPKALPCSRSRRPSCACPIQRPPTP